MFFVPRVTNNRIHLWSSKRDRCEALFSFECLTHSRDRPRCHDLCDAAAQGVTRQNLDIRRSRAFAAFAPFAAEKFGFVVHILNFEKQEASNPRGLGGVLLTI